MNALLPAAIDGELIPPAPTVSVYGTTHPLNAVAGNRIRCQVRAGASITEILLDQSGRTGVYYDERGRPMQASALVRDPKFQDRVVVETRALLARVPA